MPPRTMRTKILDAPHSFGARKRAQRWRWLLESFPDLDRMTVLDLGGDLLTWQRAPVRAEHVHIVNLSKPPDDLPSWAEVDKADACSLPDHILSRRYDLVFSNSVIEHVGGHIRRLRFRDSIRKVSDAYWVQTPYRYFPVEPHWLFPGFQFLPIGLRLLIGRRWPLAHTVGKARESVLGTILSTELLDRTQLQFYFPDAVIRSERAVGLTKSLIAIRGARPPARPAIPTQNIPLASDEAESRPLARS